MSYFLPLISSITRPIKDHPLLTIIGHVTEPKTGNNLITGLGQQIELTAQGWVSHTKENKED